MANTKKTRGRPIKKTQTPERVYFNTRINLGNKKRSGKVTEEEYNKLLVEAKIKMLQTKH